MALLVRGTRANGNTRGLLVAGILVCKGEGVLIGVVQFNSIQFISKHTTLKSKQYKYK